MKVLVTGSAGFVGFHVAKRLLLDGHDVVGVDAMVPYYDVRLKEQRHAILAQNPRFEKHLVDVSDMPAIRAVMDKSQPDVIVHLAAQAGVRYALEHPEAYVSANVVGTFNLLEICRQSPVQHFLTASTSSVYGANTQMPFLETDNTDTPLTIYSATKKGTELIGHCYAHLWNQPVTVFRFFSVYGSWGRPDMALYKFTESILRREPIEIYNHGNMERDFTYVDDLVDSVVRLIPCTPTRGQPVADFDSLSPVAPFRVVNIGNGSPVSLLDFISELEKCLGKTAIRNYVEMQPGDVPKTWADTRLLRALTGSTPSSSVAHGIAAFVTWFKEYRGM